MPCLQEKGSNPEALPIVWKGCLLLSEASEERMEGGAQVFLRDALGHRQEGSDELVCVCYCLLLCKLHEWPGGEPGALGLVMKLFFVLSSRKPGLLNLL